MIDFIRVLRLRMARRLQIVGVVRTAVCVASPQDEHVKGIGSSFQIALPLLRSGGPPHGRFVAMAGCRVGSPDGLGGDSVLH